MIRNKSAGRSERALGPYLVGAATAGVVYVLLLLDPFLYPHLQRRASDALFAVCG